MATVTITGNTIRGATASKDNRTWQIRAVAYQYGGTGGGVITPGADWETLYPVDGVLTFTAESGSVVDIKTPDDVPYRVRIPTSNAGLWDVIEAGVAYQPNVAQDLLNAAVANAAPGFIAAELGLQTADAITTDLAARHIGFVDEGDGEGRFTIVSPNGDVVSISGTLVPPGALWSSLAARPSFAADSAARDGTTDDRAELAADDDSALAMDGGIPLMLRAGVHRVPSDLTIDSPMWFLPGAILKPDSGVTVTLAGGIVFAPMSQIFDASAGGTVIPLGVETIHARWWGLQPSTNNSVAFQGAIDAAVVAGVEVMIPAGDWDIDDALIIPPMKPLKIRGPVHDDFPTNAEIAGGSGGARLQRTGNEPAFSLIGAASDIPAEVTPDSSDWLNWEGYCRNVAFEDFSVRNDNPSATAPLLLMRGAQALHFNRFCLYDYDSNGCSLIDAQGTQDVRLQDVTFGGGGDVSGIPAVHLRSGDPGGTDDGYNGCNSWHFVNCASNNYFGPAFKVGDNEVDSIYRTHSMMWVNQKMDSYTCTGSHFVVGRGAGIHVSNMFVSHSTNSDPVIDLQRCGGFYGDVSFNYAAVGEDAVIPDALVEVSAVSLRVNLDINIWASAMGETDNVATIANESDPTVDIRINGIPHRINGDNDHARFIRHGLVYQAVSSDTTQCGYVFSKSGRNRWYIGNPGTFGADTEYMKIFAQDTVSAGVADFLTFRSSAQNPAAATRQAIFNAEVRVSNTAATITSGTGSPEGVRTAFIGSIYMQTNGVPGAAVWVKESGAGNTGWFNLNGRVAVPASSSSPGVRGQFAADASYTYQCIGVDTWTRTAVTSTSW